MRGEDSALAFLVSRPRGSPPHARGRHRQSVEQHRGEGITPACAGKTHSETAPRSCAWDHPRMRGEDPRSGFRLKRQAGSPPHARGRPLAEAGRTNDIGSPPHARGRPSLPSRSPSSTRITPACAGKTRSPSEGAARSRDHPRMRGEDVAPDGDRRRTHGSPPHARGRQRLHVRRALRFRITPACAGKTVFTTGTGGTL